MITVRLSNDYGSAVWDCKTPIGLKRIFNIARKNDFTVQIIRGWEYAWVQTAWQNWQEEFETA